MQDTKSDSRFILVFKLFKGHTTSLLLLPELKHFLDNLNSNSKDILTGADVFETLKYLLQLVFKAGYEF